MSDLFVPENEQDLAKVKKLKKLTQDQVLKIDTFLNMVGDYGEVVLVIDKGELKYINTLESHKVLTSDEMVKKRKV